MLLCQSLSLYLLDRRGYEARTEVAFADKHWWGREGVGKSVAICLQMKMYLTLSTRPLRSGRMWEMD